MPSAAFPVVEGPMTASCRAEAGAGVTDSGDDAGPESANMPLTSTPLADVLLTSTPLADMPLASTQVRTRNFVKLMATITVLPAGRVRVRVLTGQGVAIAPRSWQIPVDPVRPIRNWFEVRMIC